VLAGLGGGSATTTYAENIGVMAATRVYSTAAYWVAAAVAIALSLCPKVGAAISAIPAGVLGGATIVLYGLVGVLGVRIWLTNHVDFSLPVNQMTAAIALVIGIADFTWRAGDLTFTGIALGSIAALVVYHGMQLLGALRGRRHPAALRGGAAG
jgi:xanthine/uracil permease